MVRFGFLFALAIAGCSGAGGGTDAAVALDLAPTHVSIQNAGTPYDGHAPSNPVGTGTGLFAGDELNSNQYASNPANNGQGWGLRFFVTFLHPGALPAGVTVISAKIMAVQSSVQGMPYAGLGGGVHVDHLDYGMLAPTSYAAAALESDIGVLSTDPSVGAMSGKRQLDVTAAVTEDLAAQRGRSQFRFRFPLQSNNNSLTDLAIFSRIGDPNDNSPGAMTLEVDFVAP